MVSEQQYVQNTPGAPFGTWPHTSYGYTVGVWDTSTNQYREEFRAVIPFHLDQYWGGGFLFDSRQNEPVLVSRDQEGVLWLIRPLTQGLKPVKNLPDPDAFTPLSDDRMLVNGELDEISSVDIQGQVRSYLPKGWLYNDPNFTGPPAGFSYLEYFGDGNLIVINPKHMTLVEAPPKNSKIIRQWPIDHPGFAKLKVLTFLETKAVVLPSGEIQIWNHAYVSRDEYYALGIRIGPQGDEYRWVKLPASQSGGNHLLDVDSAGDLHLTDNSDHSKVEWATQKFVTVTQYEFNDFRWQQRGMAIPAGVSYRVSNVDLPRTGHGHLTRSRAHSATPMVITAPTVVKPVLPPNFIAKKNLDPTTFALAVETLAWMYDEHFHGKLPPVIPHADVMKLLSNQRFRFVIDYLLDLQDADLAPFGLMKQGVNLVAMPNHTIKEVHSAELAELLVLGTSACAANVAARNKTP